MFKGPAHIQKSKANWWRSVLSIHQVRSGHRIQAADLDGKHPLSHLIGPKILNSLETFTEMPNQSQSALPSIPCEYSFLNGLCPKWPIFKHVMYLLLR